jgi:hypothetical protein
MIGSRCLAQWRLREVQSTSEPVLLRPIGAEYDLRDAAKAHADPEAGRQGGS